MRIILLAASADARTISLGSFNNAGSSAFSRKLTGAVLCWIAATRPISHAITRRSSMAGMSTARIIRPKSVSDNPSKWRSCLGQDRAITRALVSVSGVDSHSSFSQSCLTICRTGSGSAAKSILSTMGIRVVLRSSVRCHPKVPWHDQIVLD